ncbi:MAG: ATP-dependent DNA helicase UvrD2 [Micrococcaceae bacterium]
MVEYSVLAGLDAEQRQAASSIGKPLRILAGAGTGKTRAITHRIAYAVRNGFYRPQNILAVTFTTKAAAEMGARLRDLGIFGMQARTFHSAALRQVQYFWPEVFGGKPYRVLRHKIPLVGQACTELGVVANKEVVRDIASEIEWAKVNMFSAAQYSELERKSPIKTIDHVTLAKLYECYEKIKNDQLVIDLEDVLLLCSAMIEKSPKVAAEIRNQYRHFVVDEFQDVSKLQYAVLKSWLGNRDDLCVVGDPSQTIYSFSGARQEFLLQLQRDFPKLETISLLRNYRSSGNIVQLANRILKASRHQKPLQLISNQAVGTEVTFVEYANEAEEAQAVATKIKEQINEGRKPSDFAILYRTNYQSSQFEEALADENISYQVSVQEKFFRCKEVIQAINLLQKHKNGVHKGAVSTTVAEIFELLDFEATKPPTSRAARARWENLNALLTLAKTWEETHPEATFADFTVEIAIRTRSQLPPEMDSVTLASFHAAKGLEWPVVYLVGVREGLVPINYVTTLEEIEEERRLFYVAVTRAERELEISWAQVKRKEQDSGKSRFLVGIEAQKAKPVIVEELEVTVDSADFVCKVCNQKLVLPSEINSGRCSKHPAEKFNESLYKALAKWRMEKVTMDKVIPTRIMPSRVMHEIAETSPKNQVELMAVSGISPYILRYKRELLDLIAKFTIYDNF